MASDIDALLSDLDQVIRDAPEVPLVGEARIDRETVYDILDRMRALLPEEEKQARWVVKERTDLLREAKKEADQIITEARRLAHDLTSRDVIQRESHRHAEEIVEEAKYEERRMRLQAEDYADSIMETLQENLDKFTDAARRGRRAIAGDPPEERQPPEIRR